MQFYCYVQTRYFFYYLVNYLSLLLRGPSNRGAHMHRMDLRYGTSAPACYPLIVCTTTESNFFLTFVWHYYCATLPL